MQEQKRHGRPSGEGTSPESPQTRPLLEGEDFADINLLLIQLQNPNVMRPGSGNNEPSGNTGGGGK